MQKLECEEELSYSKISSRTILINRGIKVTITWRGERCAVNNNKNEMIKEERCNNEEVKRVEK